MLNVLWIVSHCKILCESQCSGSEIDVNCNKRNRCASWLYMPANDSLQSEHAYLSAEIYHIRPSLGKKKKKKKGFPVRLVAQRTTSREIWNFFFFFFSFLLILQNV